MKILPLILVAGSCLAARPDFSGEWKLNLEKSNFAQSPPPEKWTRRVVHREPRFHLLTLQTRNGVEQKSDVQLTTDGAETTMELAGQHATGSIRWEGDALVLQTKRGSPRGDIHQKETWTMSADGKTLTCVGRIYGDFGEMEVRFVFEK